MPVRIIVDQRANSKYAYNETMINYLRDAGIPMREKYAGADILHFKMMLFHGQDMLQFSKANYGPWALAPAEANVSYDDEAVFFTDDDRLTNTFRRRFEDLWTDTTAYRNFANMTGPPFRIYPVYPIDPSMNFPPLQDFANRAVARYDQEQQRIDALVFRVYDDRQTNAMIRAVARGVPVRIITEPQEYRNPLRVYDSEHVDRMYMGGVQLKIRKHDGLMHEASVVMHSLGEVIFGSSNWTAASAIASDEHNFFYEPSFGKPWFFQWFADQFERKWNDSVNYEPFQPLPPGTPTYSTPINGASGQAANVTLTWDGGTWAHFYDIYFGTSSTPPLREANLQTRQPAAGRARDIHRHQSAPRHDLLLAHRRKDLGAARRGWTYVELHDLRHDSGPRGPTGGAAGSGPGHHPGGELRRWWARSSRTTTRRRETQADSIAPRMLISRRPAIQVAAST